MLRRIVLKDFRKHRSRSIDFGGITAILGPNGAGKSSVLDAIEVALYPDKYKEHRKYITYNVRKGEKMAEVRLEVSKGNDTVIFHTLIRTTGKKNNPTVSYNGKTIDHTTARKLLGLPVDTKEYRTLYYIRQGELSRSPKDLADIMNDLLKISHIKKILEILKSLEKELGSKVDGIKRDLPLIDDHFKNVGPKTLDVGDLQRRVEDLEDEVERREEEIRRLEGDIETKEGEKESLEGEIKRLEKTEKELDDAVRRKQELKGRLETLQRQIELLERELAEMGVQIEEGENLKGVGNRKKEVKEDREALINIGGRLRRLLEERNKRLERIEALRSELRDVLPLLVNWTPEEVRTLRDCARARRECEETKEAYEEYERLKEERDGIERKLERLRDIWVWLKRMEDLKREIEGKLGRLPSLEEYDRELEDLRRRIASLKAEEKHERERLEALKRGENRCPVCGREIEDPEALLKATEESLKSLREDLKELSATLERYKEVDGKMREYYNLASRVREAVEGLDGVDLPADVPLEDLRRTVEEIGKRLKGELEEIDRRLEELREAYERYARAKGTVKECEGKLSVILEPVVGPFAGVSLYYSFYEKDLASLSDGTLKAYEEMVRLEGEVEGLKGEIEETVREVEGIVSRYPEAAQQPDEVDDLERYVEFWKGNLQRLEEALTRKEEYLKKLSEKEKMERELKRVKREIEALGKPEEELEKVREKLERLREKEKGMIEELERMRGELEKLKGELEIVKEKLKKLQERLKEWKRLRHLRSRVEDMRRVVEEKQEKFIEARRRVFEAEISRYFLNIFGHGVSYKRLRLDENLMPILTLHNGEEVSVSYGEQVGNDEIALSGGERTALYLSYIMALRRIVGREEGVAPLLILDEPTTHLDADRREDVWDILDQLHRKEGIQIVVVTHDTHSFDGILGNRPYVRRINL